MATAISAVPSPGKIACNVAVPSVVAVSELPVEGLDPEEVDQMVRHLAAVADTFDDKIAKEFGATKA